MWRKKQSRRIVKRTVRKSRKYIKGGQGQPVDKYIAKLKELYPLCKHDTNHEEYAGHKTTYGEMTYEGIESLYNHIQTFNNGPPSYFIDVGSGRGKLCLYMAQKPTILKSIGVELVTTRYEDAKNLKTELSNTPQFTQYTNKTEFINADVLTIDLKSKFDENKKVFVWFSNLCFDSEITIKIFDKLISELPQGSVICCSKISEDINNNEKLINRGITSIPMSWSQNSNVNIYQIK